MRKLLLTLFATSFFSIHAEQQEIISEPSCEIVCDITISGLDFNTLAELFELETREDKLFSANITVKNKNDFPVHVATYYKKSWFGFDCKKESENVVIAPKTKTTIKRPKWNWLWSRKILASKDPDDLKEKLKRKEYKSIAHTSIEDLKGDTFYTFEKNHSLHCYNYITWNIIKPVLSLIEEITDPVIDDVIKLVAKHEYINKKATVRTGTNLCSQEKKFINTRKKIAHENLENVFEMEIPKHAVPNIAICFSGGGYRAMMGTLGALVGTKKIGILDSITYMAGLSGSTWLLAPWTTRGGDIYDYKKILRKKVNLDIISNELDPVILSENILKKVLFQQDLSIIDVYGSFLANRLFHDYGTKRQKLHLSNTQQNITKGNMPMPICTAIEPSNDKYEWFEFTPFEVGSTYLNAFIPTWAFGRRFKNGHSTNFAPEQSIGFLMGIWGSACSVDMEELYHHAGKKLEKIIPKEILKPLLTESPLEDVRISPAHAYNFTKGMSASPMRYEDRFTLVDAGIHINLPAFPLLRPERNIDVLIVCDYSANSGNTSAELKKVATYAHSQGMKFPKITTPKKNSVVSVFKERGTPTIIYLPLIKNENFDSSFDPKKAKFCNTFNFLYSNKQFDLLTGLTEFNMVEAQDVILETIKGCIENKI